MKNITPSVLPALALLTLAGCAGTSALTTTESDGVYYSTTQDRTTAPERPALASAEAVQEEATDAGSGDVANPDYNGTETARTNANTEYYDEDYYYASRLRRFHQTPYRGMGLGYYDFAYTDPFWYGGPAYSAWGPGAFYDPFFSPWGVPGWGGSFVNINIGFGRPWYRPWRGGFGYNPYDYYGYGFGRPWGAGFGGWGGGWGGGGGFGGGWGRAVIVPQRSVVTGTRSRIAEGSPDGTTGGRSASGVSGSRSRNGVAEGGFVAPGGTSTSSNATTAPSPTGGRGRSRDVLGGGLQPTTPPTTSGQVAEQRSTTPPATEGRRWRVLSESNTGAATQAGSTPTPARRSWNTEGSRQRQEASTSEPTRTYSQPSRTYSEPSRTYSSPSRSYDSGGGSSGGSRSSGSSGSGSSGGGGGGRGRGN